MISPISALANLTSAADARGVTQIVRLGPSAPADAVAEGISVFHLDRGDGAPAGEGTHIVRLTADFHTDDAADVLLEAGFDDLRPALFVTEQLTRILDRSELSWLLYRLSAIAAPGSELIFAVDVGPAVDSERTQPRERWVQVVASVGWKVEEPDFAPAVTQDGCETHFLRAVPHSTR